MMRVIVIRALAVGFAGVLLVGCARPAPPPPVVPAPATAESPAVAPAVPLPPPAAVAPAPATVPGDADTAARTMRVTMYADGVSCPGGCDAHVVFRGSVNGTANAHAPDSTARPYQRCKSGQECRRLRDDVFNRDRPPAQQRTHGCAYEMVGTGRNSQGRTWKRLLPAACRDGTFVGRDGLDCCSGNPFADGALGVECRHFYLDPAP